MSINCKNKKLSIYKLYINLKVQDNFIKHQVKTPGLFIFYSITITLYIFIPDTLFTEDFILNFSLVILFIPFFI